MDGWWTLAAGTAGLNDRLLKGAWDRSSEGGMVWPSALAVIEVARLDRFSVRKHDWEAILHAKLRNPVPTSQ